MPLEFIDADPHHDGEGVPAAVDLSARTATPPLMVARLARVAPDHHVLTVLLHHLIADGWSLAILGDEVRTYYQRWVDGEHDVPGPETTFSQYVARERSWLASPDAAECEQYWLDQLKDAPVVIDLPFDRPRFDRPDFITDHGICELTAEETEGVAAVARAVGATPFMAVTAALYAVLRQLVGSDDVVVGIDSVNRSWPGSDELIGTFVNQLPLRLRSDDRPTFASLLALVRRQCLAAYQHERLPFHKIVAAVNPPRQAGRFPLFQVKVTHQGAWRTALALPDIEVVPAEISEVAMDLDLMLDVSGETSQLRLELVYRREVVDRETAIGWLDAVATVLRSGARRPHAVLPGTVWRNRAIDARVD